jgi:hypothetical protein
VPDVHTPRLRSLAILAACVLAATFGGAGSASAALGSSCADQVVADWYGDGRVDKLFPTKCYMDAIRSLPVDVLDYSNAKEDILRALQYRRQGEPDPGPSGSARPTNETTTEDPAVTDEEPSNETNASEEFDTSGPSSLPIPLLVLGGVALLLLAAGGAGYLSRRAQARRPGGPGS